VRSTALTGIAPDQSQTYAAISETSTTLSATKAAKAHQIFAIHALH